MDFGLEDGDEAGFAELLMVFGANNKGAGGVTEGAEGGHHGGLDSGILAAGLLIPPLGRGRVGCREVWLPEFLKQRCPGMTLGP